MKSVGYLRRAAHYTAINRFFQNDTAAVDHKQYRVIETDLQLSSKLDGQTDPPQRVYRTHIVFFRMCTHMNPPFLRPNMAGGKDCSRNRRRYGFNRFDPQILRSACGKESRRVSDRQFCDGDSLTIMADAVVSALAGSFGKPHDQEPGVRRWMRRRAHSNAPVWLK